MATEEKVYLDETFTIIRVPDLSGVTSGGLLMRRHETGAARLADAEALPRFRAMATGGNVLVTNKRIVVEGKTTVLANVAAVSMEDDVTACGLLDAQVHHIRESAHASAVQSRESKLDEIRKFLKFIFIVAVIVAVLSGLILIVGFTTGKSVDLEAGASGLAGAVPVALMVRWLRNAFHRYVDTFWPASVTPMGTIPKAQPHYAVIIESAGTRDTAVVSPHKPDIDRIVAAINQALIDR